MHAIGSPGGVTLLEFETEEEEDQPETQSRRVKKEENQCRRNF
jgi:hypothetical protein